MIPTLDLKTELAKLRDEIDTAIARVLSSGHFILGPEVEAFEREAAEFLGTAHAIGVNSGTDALVISLRARGIGPGDEVITTPFSFFATAEAISAVGATPVFADIDDTFNIDLAIEPLITERIKAILPVHLFGRPVAMDRILAIAQAHDLFVLEDCAQSFGATWRGRRTGSIGDAGAFSFFPSKNLGAIGDGGLIATNDAELARRCRMLRAHGGKYDHELIGYNSRLDAVQAAVLRVKLPHVDRWNGQRRRAASRYGELLGDAVVVPELTDGHVFHQYTIRVPAESRYYVRRKLYEKGIATAVYYPIPIDALPAYKDYTPRPISLQLADEVLALPIWPEIDEATQQRVAATLVEALRAH